MNNESTAGQNDNTPLYARRVKAVSDAEKRNPMAFAGKLRAFSFRRMALPLSTPARNHNR